jgi:hypothetical protein
MNNMLTSPLYFVKFFLAQAFLNLAFEVHEGFFFPMTLQFFFLCGFIFEG